MHGLDFCVHRFILWHISKICCSTYWCITNVTEFLLSPVEDLNLQSGVGSFRAEAATFSLHLAGTLGEHHRSQQLAESERVSTR